MRSRQTAKPGGDSKRRITALDLLSMDVLNQWLQQYGYGAVGAVILLEATGLPLPAESLLISAALYAATTHRLSIFVLVPVAALGAICGDQLGYAIGRWIGPRVLARWGSRVGLTEERLGLMRFLFRQYGGRVVFLGRSVAVLRIFVSLLAGANRMPWRSFILWNALGGLIWTGVYGFGTYALGNVVERVRGPVGIGLAIAGSIALLMGIIFVKRNEKRLLDEARREMLSGATAN